MAKRSTPETSTVVSEAKKIQVKLVRSPIGYEKSQKATVKALGLKRITRPWNTRTHQSSVA
jgi:ribosomal protein L30